MTSTPLVVYFSTKSNNTRRFVEKLGYPTQRIPFSVDDPITATVPYVLTTPTYGGGTISGAVPKQVIHFLNNPDNRALLRGVISTGNSNFGEAFCLSGDIIAQKCNVPHLKRVELFGTEEDVEDARQLIHYLFNPQE